MRPRRSNSSSRRPCRLAVPRRVTQGGQGEAVVSPDALYPLVVHDEAFPPEFGVDALIVPARFPLPDLPDALKEFDVVGPARRVVEGRA
jgi:hypothetical protein